MALKELTEEQEIDIALAEAKNELEKLTNNQLIFIILLILVEVLLPKTPYNHSLVSVLRKRAEGKSK